MPLTREQLQFAAFDMNTVMDLDEDSYIDAHLPDEEIKERIKTESKEICANREGFEDDVFSKGTWRVLKLLGVCPHPSVAKSPSYDPDIEKNKREQFQRALRVSEPEEQEDLFQEEIIITEPETIEADEKIMEKAKKADKKKSSKKITAKKTTKKETKPKTTTVKKTAKKETAPKKSTVNKSTKPKKERKQRSPSMKQVGIINAIQEMISKKYMSRNEIIIELLTKFPGRSGIGISKTTVVQVPLLFERRGFTVSEKEFSTPEGKIKKYKITKGK